MNNYDSQGFLKQPNWESKDKKKTKKIKKKIKKHDENPFLKTYFYFLTANDTKNMIISIYIYNIMLGTLPKAFSQGYFPSATSQMCNFPSGNFPNVHFPK